MTYADKLKDSLFWWLGKKRPFIINDEYSIELIHIDKLNNSARIKITNLKTGNNEIQQLDSDVGVQDGSN